MNAVCDRIAAGGALRRVRADRGRRSGTGKQLVRARASLQQPALEPALRGAKLRRLAGRGAGKRLVRPTGAAPFQRGSRSTPACSNARRHGGTSFLGRSDRAGISPFFFQAKLLRVLAGVRRDPGPWGSRSRRSVEWRVDLGHQPATSRPTGKPAGFRETSIQIATVSSQVPPCASGAWDIPVLRENASQNGRKSSSASP